MESMDTLLIDRKQVATLLTMEECIVAVEQAFRQRALGEAMPPGILGVHATDGGFHIKAGIFSLRTFPQDKNRSYFLAKSNAKFPANRKRHRLPTIKAYIVSTKSR